MSDINADMRRGCTFGDIDDCAFEAIACADFHCFFPSLIGACMMQ